MSSPEPFTLFFKFPAEIQLMILNHCSKLDRVCLSLTGPDFRALALPMIRGKPRLTWVDQLGFTPGSSSPCVGQTGHGMCLSGKDKQVLYSPMSHRRKCHEVHYTAICWGCRQYSKEHPTCQVPRCKKHCTCISCPLFIRLRGSMGDRKYCASCNLFTTRSKKNNGRCTHGRVKQRKAPNNHWCRRKGLSYGYRWWTKWGTHGVDQAYQPEPNSRRNARVV